MSEILTREEFESRPAVNLFWNQQPREGLLADLGKQAATIEALAEALKRYDRDDRFEPPRYTKEAEVLREKGWLE